MKIQTSDCVLAIINYFESKEIKDFHFLNPKMWKRLSKNGSGNSITRTFENKATGDIVYVISSETEILEVTETKSRIKNFSSFTKPTNIDPIEKEFPYKKVYQYATVYYKEQLGSEIDFDDDEIEDMNKYKLNKDVVIALAEGGDYTVEISEIIKFTGNSHYYTHEDHKGMTTDGVLLFMVADNMLYMPGSEISDSLPDYNFWGDEFEEKNKKELEKMVKKYNITNLLLLP